MNKATALKHLHSTAEERLPLPADSFLQLRRDVPMEHVSLGNIEESDNILFEQNHRMALAHLMKGLHKMAIDNVVLEGAHIYADEDPDDFHRLQMRETALLRAFLIRQGIDVKSLLFIDDFHPESQSLDVQAYVHEAIRRGWPIDEVWYESDMVPIANIMIGVLDQIGATIQIDKGTVLNKNGRPYLRHPENGKHSCSMLDAAFSVLKFRLLDAQAIVNVLPRGMKKQQKTTRTILGATLGVDLSFHTFYVQS